MVHGLAGLTHAQSNCWPLILLSGSSVSSLVGKGAFQELDQCAVAQSMCKGVFKLSSPETVLGTIREAVQLTVTGQPGAVYVDCPSDFLKANCGVPPVEAKDEAKSSSQVEVTDQDVRKAFELISSAKRPLLVIGKGAAFSR
jgi:thiamine pyrophosphate-dependent acetolactate synthase large subunit-like protein